MNITFLLILILWLSFTFFFKNVFNIRAKGQQRYLLWGLVVCLFSASELLFRAFVPGRFPHYLFLELPVYFLLPVLCHLLVSNGRRKTYQLMGYDYLQLIPALLCLLVLLPVYGLDGVPKQALALSPTVLLLAIKWLFVVQLFGYLVALTQKLRHIQKSSGETDSRWWLVAGLGLFTSFYISGLTLQVYGIWVEGAGLFCLIVAGWVYKRAVVSVKEKASPYDKPGVMEMIEMVMLKERLYLRKDLSLNQLSETLGLSTHKVSRALNQEAGIGYNDYINRYRVEEVIRLLKDRTHKQYTLEAISGMAGFRSLTTFNCAFKKHTGQTPKQFKI